MPSIIAGKCLYHFWLLIFVIRIACWAYMNTLIWCSHEPCTEQCIWEVLKAGQQNAKYLNIVSFAAVLNNSLDRDARAQRCEVSLQLTSHVSDGTAWHRRWELQQGRLHFAWDIHRYFVLMANASDPVTRKWLAPGSRWICICFMSFFPPSPWMEAVLPLG